MPASTDAGEMGDGAPPGGGYLSEDARNALKLYKYRGQDNSLLYKFVLSPVAAYCVEHFTPLWLAPNAITLIGLSAQVLAFLVVYSYSSDLLSVAPWWSYALSAACMIFYSVMDNMDGKQARKTGSSSPLGLLFDHGLDAVNAGLLGCATGSMHVVTGPGWKAVFVWLFSTAPFYYNTWEEFHTGELVLPIINGANEGVHGVTAMLIMSAVVGPEGLWTAPHTVFPSLAWALTPVVDFLRLCAGDPLSLTFNRSGGLGAYVGAWAGGSPVTGPPLLNNEILLACIGVCMAFTVLHQTTNVFSKEFRERGASGLAKPVARQLPYLLLTTTIFAWMWEVHCNKVVHEHWVLFFGCAGVLFVNMTVRLMVAHVTCTELSFDPLGFAAFAITPALLSLRLTPGGADTTVLALRGLYLGAAVAWATSSHFIFHITSEIAHVLDIDVFDITKQVQRSQGAQQVGGAGVPPPQVVEGSGGSTSARSRRSGQTTLSSPLAAGGADSATPSKRPRSTGRGASASRRK